MTGYQQDNAASVRGVALRVTRLGADGAPATGTAADVYLTTGFIKANFTPVYSDGDEVEVKNAAGAVCVYYKMPDTLKNTTVGLELCDPDPVLTEMLVGGNVLTVAGEGEEDDEAVGYAAPAQGVEAAPYGVAVEVWAQAVVNGKAANNRPYWHYLFPYAKFKLDGDRVVENGALATVFAGTGGGNAAFGEGPALNFDGVTPPPAPTAFQWEFPEHTDRPYLYARTSDAPVGLQGCFENTGILVDAVAGGIPAVMTPTNAARPADIQRLIDLGPLGNTIGWTEGQYFLLGDASHAFWTGDGWAEGEAPALIVLAETATAGTPGTFGPLNAETPENLAAMADITASPTTAWTVGQRMVLGDESECHWNATAWVVGRA